LDNVQKDFQSMINKLRFGTAAAVLALAAMTLGAPAQADGVKVGVLSCHVSSGWGFIFGSSKDLRCSFSPSRGDSEHYRGSVSKFGVDIGYTSGGVLIWDVVAPQSGIKRGALTGDYAGASASATAGVGVGANVLVGGFDRSVTLQPVSVEGNQGLNIAAGIGAISLQYVAADDGMRPPPRQ
jgi:hypothetical protein